MTATTQTTATSEKGGTGLLAIAVLQAITLAIINWTGAVTIPVLVIAAPVLAYLALFLAIGIVAVLATIVSLIAGAASGR